MSYSSTVFEQCSAQYDIDTQLADLLNCIADDIEGGVDNFFVVITVSKHPLVNGRALRRFGILFIDI